MAPPSSPLTLSPEDKLDVLQFLDEFRFWQSLDDERRCSRCHQIITGRQILVLERGAMRGQMRLQCPTPGCVSAPSDWVYLDPVRIASFRNSIGNRTLAARPNVRAANGKYRESKKAVRSGQIRPHHSRSFRMAFASLPVLRSLATGFHSIYPVA
jgi:hypothetical protein